MTKNQASLLGAAGVVALFVAPHLAWIKVTGFVSLENTPGLGGDGWFFRRGAAWTQR